MKVHVALMNIVSLEDYKAKTIKHCPREITFHGHTFDKNGDRHSMHICVRVENGDALGVMDRIIQNGGIGETTDDGTYMFMPWPCAAVEIRDVLVAPIETTEPETRYRLDRS